MSCQWGCYQHELPAAPLRKFTKVLVYSITSCPQLIVWIAESFKISVMTTTVSVLKSLGKFSGRYAAVSAFQCYPQHWLIGIQIRLDSSRIFFTVGRNYWPYWTPQLLRPSRISTHIGRKWRIRKPWNTAKASTTQFFQSTTQNCFSCWKAIQWYREAYRNYPCRSSRRLLSSTYPTDMCCLWTTTINTQQPFLMNSKH